MEPGIWGVESGIRGVESGIQEVGYGIQGEKSGIQGVEPGSGEWNPESKDHLDCHTWGNILDVTTGGLDVYSAACMEKRVNI